MPPPLPLPPCQILTNDSVFSALCSVGRDLSCLCCGVYFIRVQLVLFLIMETNQIINVVIPEDKNSICRFCLELSDDLININDCPQGTFWSKAGNVSIHEVFKKLRLKIDNAKFLPNRICQKCKNGLEDFFLFVSRIENNEELLRKVYSEDSDVLSNFVTDADSNLSFQDCEVIYDIEKNELEAEGSSANIIKIEHDYGVSTEGIPNLENFRDGENTYEYNNSNNFWSDEISEYEKSPSTSIQIKNRSLSKTDISMKASAKVVTPTISEKKTKKNLPCESYCEEDEPFYIKECLFCERRFSSDDLRTLHYLEHVVQATEDMVPQRPFCLHCGLLTETKEALEEHIISKHNNDIELNCGDCNIRFSHANEMRKHVNKHHIEEFELELDTELKCVICKMPFDNVEDMMKHSLEHLSRRFTCLTCRNRYICSAALNEHHRTHPQYKFKCPICKKRVINRPSAMRQHLESHNTERIHECDICKKRYSSEIHFKYHRSTHFKPDIICPQCGYATKYTKDYVMHLRTHTNERPFKCTFEECGRAFKTNSTLSAHIKEHLNIKNFACEYCDYRTSRSVGLTLHRRKHTGERPFMCKFCGKDFNRQWSLTMHLKKLHPQRE